jgi:uncharacterized membrane protein
VSHWFLQPILNSYVLVAAIVAVLVLLLVIGPAFRRLPRPQRLLLTALRLCVIALVAVAMLRPTHISTTRRQQTAVLILLFDQSRSMQLPQASGGTSRWSAQQDVLRQAEPLLRELSNNMEVKLYGFDIGLHPVDLTAEPLALPETPDGQQTDIGTSLHAALQRELGKRLAGVVLLGDGVQTAFRPAVEIPEAGRELARLGYPLYAVPFGQGLDAVQARDVAVENLQDQYTVFVKNELPVTATIAIRGCTNQAIPVRLLVEKPDGQVDVVGPVDVVARVDEEQVAVELRYVPEQPGNYKLTMEAAEQAGELVTKNNRLSAFLRVLEGGLKLLYLEGELREEQLFLRRVLEASPDMELEFVWIDSRQRDKWPVDVAGSLRDAKYDAFILGDLDAAALGKDQLQLLAEAVGRGKGLALLGGYHSYGAGGYRDTPLADVMPITMDRLERQDFAAPIRPDLHLAGPQRMRPAGAHPLTSLSSGADNVEAWDRLPPLAGANRFLGVKDAAGVRIVAENEAGQPLLVVGEYGQGRVVAMAGDSTYRWAMRGFEAEHRRFWRQVILWLVGREDREQDQVWVKLDQRRFQPDSRVTFAAGVNSPSGEPMGDADLRGELTLPDGQRRELRLTRDGTTWRGSIETVTAPGDYVMEVTASRDGNVLGTGRGEFMVFDRDVELSMSAADHDQLARLAAMTQEFGGRVVAPEQVSSLLEDIRDRPPEMEIEVQTKWQLADTAGDAWALLLLFVALLTAEWFLRKKWGLV